MLLCCMAATLMLACSNDKSGGHDGDEGVETEVNGTTTYYDYNKFGLQKTVRDDDGTVVKRFIYDNYTSNL